MANNYFISYDLMAPGQHYDQVIAAIKATGNWAKVEYSFFYVRSTWTLEAVAQYVWASMTPNDKLVCIDASNNNFYAYNLDQEVLTQMQTQWNA